MQDERDIRMMMDEWTDEEMAIATDVVISWFAREGRKAYELVLEQQPDPAHLGECVAWLNDLEEAAGNG